MNKLILTLMMILFASTCSAQQTKSWNWDAREAKHFFVEKQVNKSRKSPTIRVAKPIRLVPVVKKDVVVYPRYIMQRLDGSFSSPRFLDSNSQARELYGVSGAAIKAYGLNSMKARNSLERSLYAERNCWEATKWYYLHNPTPWQPSK